MYDLLSGPVFVFSAAVCILGLIARIIWYIRGLDWQIDRVAYTQYPWAGIKGALRSILHWIVPFASSNWRLKPFFTIIFFVFHIGILMVPLFLEGHMVILEQRVGISWPSIPMPVADFFTLAVLVAGLCILIRRFALPEVRILTSTYDVLLLLLTLAPFLTGYLAVKNVDGYNAWLIAHIIFGNLLLLAIPFTKLSHVVMFFLTRAQIGMDFGIKRGGRKGRGIVW